MDRPKSVIVTWLDADWDTSEFVTAAQVERKPIVELETVGFLVTETDAYIAVGSERDPVDGSFRGVTRILLANVVRVEEARGWAARK